jgi:phosphate transport system substrate-binding protein
LNVVHRADGSGTTFNYTRFLSARSERWQAEIGHDLTVAWPVGMAARGSRGVGETVQRTRGALGYVDLAQARRLGLADARVRNRAGVFVRPSVASFQATAATADWAAAGDFALLLEDTGEPAAYPIPLTVFALMPLREAGTTRSEAALAFLAWALRDGAGVAEGLGYVPLPAPLVEQVEAYWARRLAWAGRPLVAGFTPAGAARD